MAVWVYVVHGSRSMVTARVARAIAAAVEWSNQYEARPACDVDPAEIRGPGLVFLGCRSGGSELDRSIRGFLDGLVDRTMYDVAWAIFDTRGEPIPVIAGSGIRRLRRAVEHRGGRLLTAPESFYADEDHVNVPAGELERARAWAASTIAAAVKRFRDPAVRAGNLSGATIRPIWETWSPTPAPS